MKDTDQAHRRATREQRQASERRQKVVRFAISGTSFGLVILLLSESGREFRFAMARFAAFILRLL